MPSKKKAAPKKEKKSTEPVVTDILEERFKDEEGNEKVHRIFMNGNKKVGEETINE